jgi:hypothetical protein
MTEPIAETQVTVRHRGGETEDMTIRVFCPQVHEQDASCEVSLGDRHPIGRPIYGVDTFQALTLALRLVRVLLADEEKQGAVITLPGNDVAFDWRKSWFGEGTG